MSFTAVYPSRQKAPTAEARLTEAAVQRLLAQVPPVQARRRQIWDLDASLHCSIVGTCLETGEVRSLARKTVQPAPGASEHALHGLVVGLARKADGGGKLLNKLLDRKHATAITHFDRAANVDEVRALWREARERGEVPGAYWALLTHPATTNGLLRDAFGEVHMLSHLVGAANRADIRRLQLLEQEKAALQEKLGEQAEHHRAKLAERDRAIEELRARQAEPPPQSTAPQDFAVAEEIEEWRRRLDRQASHLAALEQRAVAAEQDLAVARADLASAADEITTLRAECAQLEQEQMTRLDGDDMDRDLGQRCLLYVGGRGQQVPHFRTLVERANGRFLHHDGGLEENMASLAGQLGRADAVLFPVDCISHQGYQNLKQLCRRQGTPYVPMRTASLAAFLRALDQL